MGQQQAPDRSGVGRNSQPKATTWGRKRRVRLAAQGSLRKARCVRLAAYTTRGLHYSNTDSPDLNPILIYASLYLRELQTLVFFQEYTLLGKLYRGCLRDVAGNVHRPD